MREGQTVLISYRGEEVAEIRPVRTQTTVEERLRRLEDRGLLQGGRDRRGRLAAVAERPGALARFLADRD